VPALAIQHALDTGAQVYDFMMGGGHFKSSLTNAEGQMAWASIQRPRLRRLEDWLRQQRQRLKPAQPAPAAASS
jgi:CelD/BcsL family acetyltransferase involved in cellulose biosynthesis